MKKLILNLVIGLLLLGCMAVQQATEIAKPIGEPLQSVHTETAMPTKGPTQNSLTECPTVAEPGSSWERYKPSSIEDLVAAVSQVSSPSTETEISYYIETDAGYQFPSCVRMEYEGKYREIAEPRKMFFTAWSGIFGKENQQQVIESIKHEALFTENDKEYWFSVYEPLIPYMEDELSQNKPAIIYVVWAGTVFVDQKADHIFVIGEFSKDE